MQLKKSFTLILLTKGRHNFTRRWLNYMKIIKFKYPIIIADGQDDDETKKMISEINQNQNLSIRYFRYNTHSSYHDYYKMKLDVLNKVATDLVMLCDNDDFILPTGLDQQIEFLNKNTELVSASGRILNFEINNYDYVTYGQDVTFLKACEYYRFEEPLSDWRNHINSVFKNFQPNFYNVFQTKFMKIIAKELVELNFSDLVINEFYIQLRAATLGKSKILGSSFHYLRQRGTSSISLGYDFSESLLKKNMPEDVRKLSSAISNIVCEQTSYKKNDFFLFMLKSFSIYLNFYLSRITLKFRFPKVYKIKIKILEFYNNNFRLIKKTICYFKTKINLRLIFNLSEKNNLVLLKKEIFFIQNFLNIK